MLFSTSIPSRLQEHPNVLAFTAVLDALQNFKAEIISESLRVNNAAILMDKKWLLKKLGELGVTDIPLGYPVQILQQYLLNADTVFRTRGSKIGIEFYCSLLSLGKVSVDDESFYKREDLLLLDSDKQGFITEDNSTDAYYLCSDSEDINKKVSLSITIKSKFFNGKYPKEALIIKEYLNATIDKQLGFSPNKEVTFTFQESADFYHHKLLNPYFV